MSDILFTPDPINKNHPLAEGLKACWVSRFGLDGSKRLFDLVAGHHGDLENDTHWVQSSPGAALSFTNASEDKVVVSNAESIVPFGNLTIVSHFKQNSDIAYPEPFPNSFYSGLYSCPTVKLCVNPSSVSCMFMCNGTIPFTTSFAGLLQSTYSVPVGQWAVAVVTVRFYAAGPYTYGTVTAYVNGKYVGGSGDFDNYATITYDLGVPPDTVDPGRHYIGYCEDISEIANSGIPATSTPTGFDGEIATTMLYHRCLPHQQVRELSDSLLSGDNKLFNTIPDLFYYERPIVTYTEVGSGGAVVGSSAPSYRILVPGVSSGAIAGGEVIEQFLDNHGQGGVKCGGTAFVAFTNNKYTASGSCAVSGSAYVLLGGSFDYEATGSVPDFTSTSIISLACNVRPDGYGVDSPPDNFGVNVGYSNSLNPTTASIQSIYDYELKWRLDSQVVVDMSVSWSTGESRMYWYRIRGKGKPNGCPPVDVNDPCCMTFLVNLHARSLDELCGILKAQNWKWPIASIQKFSRPAMTADVAADAALGITYDCNVATDVVDFCNNIVCQEFCIDFDLSDIWGIVADALAIQTYEMSGSVFATGFADTSYALYPYDLFYTSDTTPIIMSGDAPNISSGYGVVGSGAVVMSGEVDVKATHFEFVGGLYPYDSGDKLATDDHQFQALITDRPWINPEAIYADDGTLSICDVSFQRYSNYLVARGFGFNVPENGYEVLGIQVSIKRFASAPVQDEEVCLVLGDEIISDNKAQIGVNWPIGFGATYQYGGAFEEWTATLDAETVNDPSFGIALRVKSTTNVVAVASVDQISVQVFYAEVDNQFIQMSGTAGLKASAHHFTATGSIDIGNPDLELRLTASYLPSGRGQLGPLYLGVTMDGEAMPHQHYTAVANEVLLSGDANVKLSDYLIVGTGGIESDGEAITIAANQHWIAQGSIVDSGSAIATMTSIVKAGVLVGGTASNELVRYYTMSGSVDAGGEAGVVTADWRWASTGSIIVTGRSLDGMPEDVSDQFGVLSEISDFSVAFGGGSAPVAEAVTGSIDACGCIGLPLHFSFNHNLIRSNRFSRFLVKNNISTPSILTMRYNRINQLWQYNAHYKGKSTTSSSNEAWNLLFTLQCTSLVGGIEIGETVWKLMVQVEQRNLSTGATYETKVIVGFLPEVLCKAGRDFDFTATIDTQQEVAEIAPSSTIYTVVLSDTIGLFKEPYWILNPNLSIAVSQAGLSNPTPRITLTV